MSEKIKMYVSKLSIAVPKEVTKDLKNKIRTAIPSIDFGVLKYGHVVDKSTNTLDTYRVLGGSKEFSKDGRYLSGFLLKESTLITGKIDESTEVKQEKRSDNDEGIRFTIDLSEWVIVYNIRQHFKIAQFNRALRDILNNGIKKLGITKVDLNIENAKDDFSILDLKDNLKLLGEIEEIKIRVELMEGDKNYPFIDNSKLTKCTKSYVSSHSTGINFDSALEKELDDLVLLNSQIEEVYKTENIKVGKIKFSGKTVTGRSFGTTENITYSVDEKFSGRRLFIDKSKDIIEDYIKTYY